MNALTSFESFAQNNSNAKFVLVDSLRQVSVLNVILSFLQKGLEVFLVIQGIVSEAEFEDGRVQVFCEQLVYNCISTGSLDSLLKALLSMLSFYVNSFHCSVLITRFVRCLLPQYILSYKGGSPGLNKIRFLPG